MKKDELIFVVPANADLVIRNPATGQRLPVSGARVPRTSYWLRRLQDKDVVEAKPKQPAPVKRAQGKE